MKSKKLNLSEMWELYRLIEPSLINRDREDILLDEIEKIIELSIPGTLVASLMIMYDNITRDTPGMEALIMLMEGLTINKFFEFVEQVKVFKK